MDPFNLRSWSALRFGVFKPAGFHLLAMNLGHQRKQALKLGRSLGLGTGDAINYKSWRQTCLAQCCQVVFKHNGFRGAGYFVERIFIIRFHNHSFQF